MSATIVGIVGVAVSSIGWGSNFIVCKSFDMKDGIVFQFWMCTGILIVGLLTLLASEHDDSSKGEGGDYLAVFSLVTMSGGMMWGVGNILTTKIVSSIGLGLGMAIWGGACARVLSARSFYCCSQRNARCGSPPLSPSSLSQARLLSLASSSAASQSSV